MQPPRSLIPSDICGIYGCKKKKSKLNYKLSTVPPKKRGCSTAKHFLKRIKCRFEWNKILYTYTFIVNLAYESRAENKQKTVSELYAESYILFDGKGPACTKEYLKCDYSRINSYPRVYTERGGGGERLVEVVFKD